LCVPLLFVNAISTAWDSKSFGLTRDAK
jgi:hypothetical protein